MLFILWNAALSGISVAQEKGTEKRRRNSEEVTNSGRYNYSTDRNCFAGFALKGSIKHFKGESPCCGGGGGRSFSIFRIKNLRMRYLEKGSQNFRYALRTLRKGMSQEAINKIDGAAAKVNLSENEAVVSYDRELMTNNLENRQRMQVTES